MSVLSGRDTAVVSKGAGELAGMAKANAMRDLFHAAGWIAEQAARFSKAHVTKKLCERQANFLFQDATNVLR